MLNTPVIMMENSQQSCLVGCYKLCLYVLTSAWSRQPQDNNVYVFLELNYRCECCLEIADCTWDGCIKTCDKHHHVVGVFCLLEDHLLPLHDQRDLGGFGEKVQVSHHTPFYWLHLRKTKKKRVVTFSSLMFMSRCSKKEIRFLLMEVA